MSGRSSIASVSRKDASRRASEAGRGSSKNSHVWAPPPERERSRATGKSSTAARVDERERILLPACLVEVRRHEGTGLVEEQRVHSRDERFAGVVGAGEVPANDAVSRREEPTVETVGALDARFLADAPHPLVGAGRGVAGLPSPVALEPARVDISPAAEQGSEEHDFDVGRRAMVHHGGSRPALLVAYADARGCTSRLIRSAEARVATSRSYAPCRFTQNSAVVEK